MVSNGYRMLIENRNQNITKIVGKNFKKDLDVEMYIIILIELIEDREKIITKINLEGVLKYHNRFCTK